MFENKSRTELSTLGEFQLIDHLTKHFKTVNATTLKAVGDDAAVIDAGNDEALLVSTDLLIEGIHFDLGYMPLKHLGYKAIAVNISDICAMNGKAEQVLVSVAVSSRYSLEAMEELYMGIQAACEHYQVDLAGGDTSSSRQGGFISITVLGRAPKSNITYRSTAKEGDLLCVSGDLGAAYAGFQLLEREKRIFHEHPEAQPDLEAHAYVISRQLRPEARVDIIQALKQQGIQPTSMIDISDGLASEVMHLCEQSNLGATVFEEKLPIDYATEKSVLELGLEPTMCALNGGEDYELLFTVSPADYDKLTQVPDLNIVGYMKPLGEGRHLISKSGHQHPLTAQGWQAFSK